ncbi:MAG: hypothetical protein H6834_16520, partial [Planctomycetes bacterium]|nr:hypothetical protein [Planctomycetota bacterium]
MFSEFFHRGGPIMYGIALMSAIALALIFDRLVALRAELLRAFFGKRSLGERLLDVSRHRQVDWGRFRNHRDTTARVLARYHLDGPEAAAQVGNEALAHGARGLGALDTIVQISTNVGL